MPRRRRQQPTSSLHHQKTKTVVVSSHADIQTLESRNDVVLVVKLVTLGSLRTTPASYELLCRLVIQNKYWICKELPVLESLCRLALDLSHIRDVLLPPTQAQGATLQGNVLHSFVLLKRAGKSLLRLEPDIKIRRILTQAQELGRALEGYADHVLRGSDSIEVFQARVPKLIELIDAMLAGSITF